MIRRPLAMMVVLLGASLAGDEVIEKVKQSNRSVMVAELSDEQFARFVITELKKASRAQRKIIQEIFRHFEDGDRDGGLLGEEPKPDPSRIKLFQALAADQVQEAARIQRLMDHLSERDALAVKPDLRGLLVAMKKAELPNRLIDCSKKIEEGSLFRAVRLCQRWTGWLDRQVKSLEKDLPANQEEKNLPSVPDR